MATIRKFILDGYTKEVYLTGFPYMDDDGIGSYEFWGSRGYDSRPFVSMEGQEITWDKRKYSDEQNVVIEQYLDDNWDDISDLLCKSYDDEQKDYAP